MKTKNSGKPTLTMKATPLSKSSVKAVDWAWPGYIANNKVHCMFGAGGVGNTMVAIELSARITTGRKWPDGSPNPFTKAVAFLSAEDSVGDTIVPRFKAMAGDLSKFFILDNEVGAGAEHRKFNLLDPDCISALETALAMIPDIGVLFIDPITQFLGRVDLNNATDIRHALYPLHRIAGQLNIAVVFINHANKTGGKTPAGRCTGSSAFIDSPRIVIMLDDEDEGGERTLRVVKSNLAAISSNVKFAILPVTDQGTARLEWK